ncbi:MAG: response regulator [Parafilimonas sp.]
MSSPKTVLIIDDDADDISIFIEALSEVDTHTRCIAIDNCEEALKVLQKKNDDLPHYIFLDLNMPGMNGKECLKELKKNSQLKHIPVIIYSTAKRDDEFEETRKLGAAHFVTKPSKFSEVKQMLRYVLLRKSEF